MRVRKRNPGSSSQGHVWDEPGQILDIPAEDAAELVAINPGEFEALSDDPGPETVTEGDPAEAPKQRGRRAAVTEA